MIRGPRKHLDLVDAVNAMQPLDCLPWKLEAATYTALRQTIARVFDGSGKEFRTHRIGGMVYIVRLT